MIKFICIVIVCFSTPIVRMKHNLRGLLCCISGQRLLHVYGNYSRVESETVA